MIKKLLSIMLAIFLVFGSASAVFAEDTGPLRVVTNDLVVVDGKNTINVGTLSPSWHFGREVTIYASNRIDYANSAEGAALVTSTVIGNISAYNGMISQGGSNSGFRSYVLGYAPTTPGPFEYTVTWSSTHSKLPGSVSVTFYGTVEAPDTEPPVVTATADRAPNLNGWYKDDVTVKFSATDNKGYVNWLTPQTVTVNTDGEHTVVGKARDFAGNEGSISLTINLDKTSPNISGSVDRAPNAYGWYNDDVIVTFNASDALSGIASVTDSVALSSDGIDESVTGTAIDKAGNSSSTIVSGINIDKTVPVIITSKTNYVLNEVATWSATDSLSGIDGIDSGVIDTSKPGTYQITVKDKAGNVSEPFTYTVGYNFGGVLSPVKNDSIHKAGSTMPVKFQLTDVNRAFVKNAIATISIVKTSNNLPTGEALNTISSGAANTDNNFRYDSTSNQYIYNLNTKPYSAGTYRITITLNDGTTHSVDISLK